VKMRGQGIPDDRLAEAIELYKGGLSLMRISKQFGCSAETIRHALIGAGSGSEDSGSAGRFGNPVEATHCELPRTVSSFGEFPHAQTSSAALTVHARTGDGWHFRAPRYFAALGCHQPAPKVSRIGACWPAVRLALSELLMITVRATPGIRGGWHSGR
jgi:hypothetical protein